MYSLNICELIPHPKWDLRIFSLTPNATSVDVVPRLKQWLVLPGGNRWNFSMNSFNLLLNQLARSSPAGGMSKINSEPA